MNIFTKEQKEQFTPMMRAFLEIKEQHTEKLVFYRMGDFYEMFFDDAILASKILGITLTQKHTNGEIKIPMAGVPFHSVDTYIIKAINKGYSIVICEQVEGSESSKGIMERKISKILTPGTLLDSTLLDSKENKYLACIYKNVKDYDISWINFASGEMFCNRCKEEDIKQFVNNLNPAEILISDKQIFNFNFNKQITIKLIDDSNFDVHLSHMFLIDLFGNQYLYTLGFPDIKMSVVCYSLFDYLEKTQCSKINHIQTIKFIDSSQYLKLDSNTKKHLDLIDGNQLSLWKSLDVCSTVMGSRLLKDWINNPILNKDVINSRFLRIEYLIGKNNECYFWDWFNITDDWCDIERLITKIAFRSIKPKELSSLRNTLRTIPKLESWIEKMPMYLKGFFHHAIPNKEILSLLESYLMEEPSTFLRDGNVIASGVNSELDAYRKLNLNHNDFIEYYEKKQKIEHNIPNLKVEFNSAQGFFISISNSHLNKVPDNYIRKQTLKNCERYTTSELREYEKKALEAQEKSLIQEKILYDELLIKLQKYIFTFQKQVKILAEWDVICSFAKMAYEHHYVKPSFNNYNQIIMKEGRHPILDITTPDFVPNSIELSNNNNFGIITGPNMGGKSTVMKQLALLSIMAHIGSFVPAKEFSICDIDAIFTRFGANDDLVNGRSTFMVEMNESAFIINNATNKSLVFIDELGRGTATYDGLSLAWSITEYLATNKGCFGLFATHYLEMTELSSIYSNIFNLHVSAIDNGNQIIFTHLLENGSANKSYGIHVAELAGLNYEILSRANSKLNSLELNHHNTNSDISIINDLANLNLNSMTPMQVMEWVSKNQKKINNDSNK